MPNLFSLRLISGSKRRYQVALQSLMIVACLLVPTIVGVFTPTAAQAATNEHPTWCGSNWFPNPSSATHKQLAPGTRQIWVSGREVEVDRGQKGGNWYYWVSLSHGHVGDQVALEWTYQHNGKAYQCGDSHGYNAATVWRGSSATWTAGVQQSNIKPSTYGILIWFGGSKLCWISPRTGGEVCYS